VKVRRIVAEFGDAEHARAAILALERGGIDADDIKLVDAAPVAAAGAQGEADLAVVKAAERRFGWAALITGVVVAAIGIAVVNLIGVEPRLFVSVVVGLACFVGGFFMGGFIGVATALPVSDEAFDTWVDELHGTPVAVSVHIDRGHDPDEVEDTLRQLHPVAVRRA
jgi:hypothetical protein